MTEYLRILIVNLIFIVIFSCSTSLEQQPSDPARDQLSLNAPPTPEEFIREQFELVKGYEKSLQEARGKVFSYEEKIFKARLSGNKQQVEKLLNSQNEAEESVSHFRKKVLDTYEMLAQDHEKSEHGDRILFGFAFALEEHASDERLRYERSGKTMPEELGESLKKQASNLYKKLIKNFPDSPHLPRAYLYFAEYYFEQINMNEALELYERVISYDDSNVYGYALYKAAWCNINLQNDREAVGQFVEVIQHAELNPDSENNRSLAKQAKRDVIGPLSREFSPNQASRIFQKIAGEQSFEMLEDLAEHYFDQGQFKLSITTYHALIRDNGSSPQLCEYQVKVANCSKQFQQKPDQLREFQRSIDVMKTYVSSDHPHQNKVECRQKVAQIILENARLWQGETLGSGNNPGTLDQETIRLATELFDLALSNFDDLDRLNIKGLTTTHQSLRTQVEQWADELRQRQRPH